MASTKEAPGCLGQRAPRDMRSLKTDEPFLDTKSFKQLQAAIDAALDYERVLAVKQASLRRFILNLRIKRDHLIELGKALGSSRGGVMSDVHPFDAATDRTSAEIRGAS